MSEARITVDPAFRSEPGGPSWRQTIFHPFALTRRNGRGTVLQTPVAGPEYDTPSFGAVPRALAAGVVLGHAALRRRR